jgi:hypothetical protein
MGRTISLPAEPQRNPIVIKGAGDGDAIFDGNGTFNLFNVKARITPTSKG